MTSGSTSRSSPTFSNRSVNLAAASGGNIPTIQPVSHYIVCGMGHVGLRVVRLLLALGESVTVITLAPKEEWREEVVAAGGRVLEGDARSERLLAEAGVSGAAALLALTDDDLVNLEIVLNVKKLREDAPVVVRLFDQTLARQLENSFGIRRALAVSALAAPAFAAAVLGETLRGSFDVDEQLYVVGEMRVPSDSSLAGLDAASLRERFGLVLLGHDGSGPDAVRRINAGDRITVIGTASDWDRVTPTPATTGSRLRHQRLRWKRAMNPMIWASVLRTTWKRAPVLPRVLLMALLLFFIASVFVFESAMGLSLIDAFYFVTTTVTTIGYGDITPRDAGTALKLYTCLLMLLGSSALAILFSLITDVIVRARLEQLSGTRAAPHENHVVVVGLGHVAYRIVDELRRTDTETVVLEGTVQSEFADAVRATMPVLSGDPRTKEVLTRGDIGNAAAIIAATEDDILNLSVALAARELNPRIHAVVRLFDGEFAVKVRTHLKLDAAMSASEIAAPTFVAAALLPDVRLGFVLGDSLVAISRRSAETELAANELQLMQRSDATQFTPSVNGSTSATEVLVASRFPLRAKV
jgi:Trk K+ transport system NAD-binding subunit